MTGNVSRRAVLLGGAAALAGAALVDERPASAQSIVGPIAGEPTFVMFHVEAGW